jgi:hypothetical protein
MLVQAKLQSAGINTINISTLPAGTYLVRIQGSNGYIHNEKISKQ